MSRAALYLRVSTDEQASSLDAQESGARAWCERHGHTVVQVYRDEGVSGAEWLRRPGVAALQADARLTPRPWDLVVVRDLDRLGRDALRLGLLLETLHARGAQLVAWSTGETVQADPMARAIVMLRGVLAEQERAQTAHRTRTALRQRAERGLVVGGCVYGYATERGPEGVRYLPHPTEAAAVRMIYERHAAGVSARLVARELTAAHAPAPRGAPSWAPSTVHEILRNPRYRGEAEWGRVGGAYVEGSRVVVHRTDAEVVRYEVPALVDADLWQRAQARTSAVRAAAGRTAAALSREPRYLLVGHAVCDHCGGPLSSWRQTSGSGPAARRRVVQSYRCGWRATRSPDACEASYIRPQAPLDRAVVEALADALAPAQVRAALARARELLRPEAVDARRDEAERVARDAERRVARLTEAVAHGTDGLAPLVEALRTATAELAAARATLAGLAAPAPVLDLAAERELVALAGGVAEALVVGLDRAHKGDREAVAHLRAILGASLPQPLRARWDGRDLALRGLLSPGRVLVRPGDRGSVGDPNGDWTLPVCVGGPR